jgi:hypothetical protein
MIQNVSKMEKKHTKCILDTASQPFSDRAPVPMDRRLVVPQSRSERRGEYKNLFPLPEIELRSFLFIP